MRVLREIRGRAGRRPPAPRATAVTALSSEAASGPGRPGYNDIDGPSWLLERHRWAIDVVSGGRRRRSGPAVRADVHVWG
jgi:hypothetical protein